MGIVVAAGLKEEVLGTVDARVVVADDDLSGVVERLSRDPVEVDVFVLGPNRSDFVDAARLISRHFGQAGILILAPPQAADRVRDALRFAPLISEHVRWFRAEHDTEIARTVNRMVGEARQRRNYHAFAQSIQETLPRYEGGTRRADLFLDVLLENAPIGVVLVSDSDRILDINREGVRLLGASTMPGRGSSLWAVVPQGDRAAVGDLLDRVRQHPDRPESIPIVHGADPAERDVEITAARLTESGSAFGTLLILQDVTDRWAAHRAEAELQKQRAVARALEDQADELRRMNVELERSNRELEEFAYVASHDLQEPLRKIVSFADILLQDHVKQMDEDAEFLVKRLQAAALRMSELIRGLLIFARVRSQEYQVETVDLNVVVDEALADLTVAIKESGAQVEVSDLPTVEADASQMRRLFLNLIGNSLKFRKPDVAPLVRIGAEQLPERNGSTWYRIELSDNGIGFDDRYIDKIFSPFQRLHSGGEYSGTGMGLAICRRIVERHGGEIAASGRPGEGATFTIELPSRQSG